MAKPAVLTSPQAFNRLKEGFDTLGNLLSLTLGPTGGVVLSSTEYHDAPELLTDAAVIARRMLELPDQSQNVGAMLMRNLVWRVHQRVGDGSSITAVLATSMLAHAARCMASGANPAMIQRGIQRGIEAALTALEQTSQPIRDQADLIAIAQAVTMQTDLSLIIGEMFDLLGEHGHITVEKYMAPYLERAYLNGGVWKAGFVSPYLISAQATRKAILSDPWVVVFDGDISDAADLSGLFNLAKRKYQETKNPFNLLLCARNIKDDALNTLVTAHVKSKQQDTPGFQVAAMEFKRPGEKLRADLGDLAVLTGAEVIAPSRGRSLTGISEVDFGRARRIEASSEELLVMGGKGDPNSLRTQIQTLQTQRLRLLDQGDVSSTSAEDPVEELGMRLARLSGSAGILKVGAASKAERDVLHQKAEQGIKAVKAAMQAGIVPGGGIAYLHCIPAVNALQANHPEEQMGIQAVAQALEAPFRTILKNAVVKGPGVIMADVLSLEHGQVYDVLQNKIVPAREAGLLDPTKMLRVALETAASGARLALSTAVLVLKRKPKISYEP